jgi:ribosomal protein S18 acetylase RimI-like enzyme
MALAIRIAKPEDNEALVALARRCPMHGVLTLYVDRAPDFFFLNRLQGEEWRVYVAEKDGVVVGSISVAYRQAFVSGVRTRIAYLSDIKIPSDQRGSTVAFRLIRELYEQERSNAPEFFVCSALKGNEAVFDLFRGRAGLPYLEAVGDVSVVNLVPMKRPRSEVHPKFRSAVEYDIPSLVVFLNRFHRGYNFAPAFTPESFRAMIRDSTGCSIGNYVLAEDGEGIVAAVAYWDQSSSKSVVVLKHSALTGSIVNLSKLLHPLRIIPRLPDSGENLKVLQLRHLAYRSGGANEALAAVRYVCAKAAQERYHIVQTSLPAGDDLKKILPGGIKVQVPLRVFCGTLANRELLESLKQRPIYEDVALV